MHYSFESWRQKFSKVICRIYIHVYSFSYIYICIYTCMYICILKWIEWQSQFLRMLTWWLRTACVFEFFQRWACNLKQYFTLLQVVLCETTNEVTFEYIYIHHVYISCKSTEISVDLPKFRSIYRNFGRFTEISVDLHGMYTWWLVRMSVYGYIFTRLVRMSVYSQDLWEYQYMDTYYVKWLKRRLLRIFFVYIYVYMYRYI